jgi:RimJ/RimL family protein N-acetyltransferase
MPWLEPLTLTSEHAQLEPLSHTHHDALCDAARDGELWNLWYTAIPSPDTMRAEIDRRLALQAQGSMLPFTVRTPSGQVAGMTTYMNVDQVHHRVEIGSTWCAQSVQRTGLNTACKLLLLRHAFEALNCIAVEFRTNFFNQQSRRAIERLGARLDGILRNHMVTPNGVLRDTCVYSILPGEWPAVKAHLEHQLRRPR